MSGELGKSRQPVRPGDDLGRESDSSTKRAVALGNAPG